jgi:hypothetical protein
VHFGQVASRLTRIDTFGWDLPRVSPSLSNASDTSDVVEWAGLGLEHLSPPSVPRRRNSAKRVF